MMNGYPIFKSHGDRNLDPPLNHSDVCDGCRECAKVKIFSRSELLRDYPCDYQTNKDRHPIRCMKMAKVVVDVGLDADQEHRLDICVCEDHDEDSTVKNIYRVKGW